MRKKVIVILMLVLLFAIVPFNNAFAQDDTSEDLLKDEVQTQLNEMDFSKLEDLIYEEINITDEESFKEIVNQLINGNYNINSTNLISKISKTLFSQITSIIPLILIIIAIAILSNIVNSFQPTTNSKSISDLVHFVCISVVIVLIVATIKNAYSLTTNTISTMVNQMSIIFPILLTLLTSMGSVVTVGIYQPIVALLSGGVTAILAKIVFPIFIVSFIFIILNNLSGTIKLNKFISFLNTSFKWIIGFVFTLFAGFLTIQGISAGRYDTISLKATRFAMKSYIPILGGYLSDGLDYVLLSSILIKNAVGFAGILLLAGTILVPIINLVVLKLGLQFVSSVIEPIENNKVSNLCDDLSKVLLYPIVVILAVAFMYILSVGLIMCTVAGV